MFAEVAASALLALVCGSDLPAAEACCAVLRQLGESRLRVWTVPTGDLRRAYRIKTSLPGAKDVVGSAALMVAFEGYEGPELASIAVERAESVYGFWFDPSFIRLVACTVGPDRRFTRDIAQP
jgi:hypothetical protein